MASIAASLQASLPEPKYSGEDEEIPAHAKQRGPRIVSAGQIDETQVVLKRSGPPPYGQRAGWRPRSQEDFGDGGAFPEVPVAQYPLGMGKKGSTKSNALAIQVDSEGKVKYDAIARQGHGEGRIIHTSFKDLIPLRQRADAGEIDLSRPDKEAVAAAAERTKNALAKLISGAVAAQKPKNVNVGQRADPTFVRYTPANQMGDNSKKQDRIMKIVEKQRDPLEPPKFKHKKIPRGPPSPPPPIMHSPPRKLTAEDQEMWRIPPPVSNWKNPKGYTVPLDKRLAADGRGLQDITINDKHAQFAEAIKMAERHAREEVQLRSQMQQKLAEKEKMQKDENLRILAAKAREERNAAVNASRGQRRQRRYSSGGSSRDSRDSRYSSRSRSASSYDSRRSGSESEGGRERARAQKAREERNTAGTSSRGRQRRRRSSDGSSRDSRDRRYSSRSRSSSDRDSRQSGSESEGERERTRARAERRKENERKLRQGRMGMERKMQVLAREQNRDISEKVQLGLAKPSQSKEAMYDSRLFNQSSGFDSGFNEDNHYDKPLFAAQDAINRIYRPRANLGGDDDDDDGGGAAADREMAKLQKASRFGEVLGKGTFKGAAEAEAREGPVQFEKDSSDLFNVDRFLSEVDGKSGGGGKRGYGLQEEDDDRNKKKARVDDDED